MAWTQVKLDELTAKFKALTSNLATRMSQITSGKTAPCIDALAIGSAKELETVVLFFDIVGFTKRETTDLSSDLKRTLWTLNSVIPMMMHVIHAEGGYVEKNTGDGVMALFDAEDGHDTAAAAAVDAALTCFYVLKHLVNPYLESQGLPPVRARIGIDQGRVLIARVGVPTGSSEFPRSFLTAVGATANIACRLQENADEDGILIGDKVRLNLPPERQPYAAPSAYQAGWAYLPSGSPYWIWRYMEVREKPFSFAALAQYLAPQFETAPPPQSLFTLARSGSNSTQRPSDKPQFASIDALLRAINKK